MQRLIMILVFIFAVSAFSDWVCGGNVTEVYCPADGNVAFRVSAWSGLVWVTGTDQGKKNALAVLLSIQTSGKRVAFERANIKADGQSDCWGVAMVN